MPFLVHVPNTLTSVPAGKAGPPDIHRMSGPELLLELVELLELELLELELLELIHSVELLELLELLELELLELIHSVELLEPLKLELLIN